MPELLHLFLLSLLGSIIALIGGVVFLYHRRGAKFLEKHSVPFAAGVLITVSIIGLLPEALEMVGENAFIILLLSFFGAYLFEHFCFGIHHHSDDHHGHKPAVPLVIIGDTIHNLIDGIAIGASFLISPGLGLITALSTFLHEVPHEIGDFGILLKAGWKRSKILLVNIFSASITIAGAFSVLLFAENEILIGSLLAISAGIFLYLGASDFLPHIEVKKDNKIQVVLPLIIGVAVMLATLMAVPHAHEQEAEDHGHETEVEYH